MSKNIGEGGGGGGAGPILNLEKPNLERKTT